MEKRLVLYGWVWLYFGYRYRYRYRYDMLHANLEIFCNCWFPGPDKSPRNQRRGEVGAETCGYLVRSNLFCQRYLVLKQRASGRKKACQAVTLRCPFFKTATLAKFGLQATSQFQV